VGPPSEVGIPMLSGNDAKVDYEPGDGAHPNRFAEVTPSARKNVGTEELPSRKFRFPKVYCRN
jgi:hypothetical protein